MLHSRSAGLVFAAAWLIAGVANAGQGATSQLKKAASVESIVLLEAADQPKDFSPGVGHGILGRELFRQALLLAAREELGLTTRDASLGELAPDGLPQNNRFHLSFRVQVAKSAEFTLERRLKADVEQLLTKQWALEDKFIDYIKLADVLEKESRDGFPKALRKAGLAGKANRLVADVQVPESVSNLLSQQTLTAQFAAVRRLHELVKTKGESPWLIGALVEGYANLGLLSEHHWSAAHKVFKARSLLYAQRLVARAPKDPWGLRHLAYAEALTGLHAAALLDLRKAGRLPQGDRSRRPLWLGLLDAFGQFDLERLSKAGKEPRLAQLASLLHYIGLEDPDCVPLTITTGRKVIEENPECYRVHDSIAALGDVSMQHHDTLAGMEVFTKTFPKSLAALPALPSAVSQLLKADAAEPAVFAALVEAGKDDKHEPSWGVMGRLAQDTRFMLVWRRLDFMRFRWVVPVDEYLREALPLIGEHRHATLIRCMGLDPFRDPQFRETILGMPMVDVDYNCMGILKAASFADTKKSLELNNRASRLLDDIFRDYWVYLRHISDEHMQHKIGLSASMVRFSPHAPVATGLLAANYPNVSNETLVIVGKKHKGNPAVIRGLASRYAQMKRYDDAISWWKAYQALSPDKNGYVGMAEVYKAQGNLDRWQGVLDEYLEQKGQGLMHARVRVDMAQFLMSRKEWQKAEIYADAAAETGASWAMLCASDCQEGLGQWDKAERWRQHTSQRYPENSYEWYVWCKRTGKGDVKAAEKLATERIRTLGNQLRASDQVEIAIIQRLIGNHREAMLIFGRLYQESRAESIALHYALACDVAGKTEWRDSAIKDHAGKNTYFGRLLALFQGALAKGEKTSLDAGAVNDLLNLMPQRERNDSVYFLAAFLENRGQGKAAIVHYRNCAASSAHLLLRTLAHDAIRRLEGTKAD